MSLPSFRPTKKDLKIAILLFLVSSFAFICFKLNIASVNSRSRLALCLSILDGDGFRIDRYEHLLENDKSVVGDHCYCEKAPGGSVVVFPVVAVAYPIFHRLGKDDFTSPGPSNKHGRTNSHFEAMLLLASIPISLICAGGVVAVYCLGRLYGISRALSAMVAILLAFGTPFGCYSTLLMSHALSGSLLIIGFCWGVYVLLRHAPEKPEFRPDERKESGDPRQSRAFYLQWTGIGFVLAMAVLVEYPAAVSACLIELFFLFTMKARHVHRSVALRSLLTTSLGVLPVALAFATFNTFCFGGPFISGYRFVPQEFELMQTGFYGIRLPDPVVMLKTLIGPWNGILWYSPILILSPLWAIRNIFLGRERSLNVLALVVPAFYFLLNSSYAYWDQSPVPCRHAVSCLPFAVLPFFFLEKNDPRIVKFPFYFLLWTTLILRAIAVPLSSEPGYYPAIHPSLHFFQTMTFGLRYDLLAYAGVPQCLSRAILTFVCFVFFYLIWMEIKNDPDRVQDSMKDRRVPCP